MALPPIGSAAAPASAEGTSAPVAPGEAKSIMFDLSKKEVGNPNNSYKKLYRKLKQEFKCVMNKENISLEKLREAGLAVFAGPREMFSVDEFEAVKEYINTGGSVLFLLGEGGETKFNTNANYLLEEYGVAIKNDAVVRTVYYKYHHPKEAFVSDGILCPEISRCAKGEKKPGKGDAVDKISLAITKDEDAPSGGLPSSQRGGLEFVYPYGATLSVQKPAIPILSTGPISYPLNRPVMGVYHKPGAGRLCVAGSVRIWDDEFFDQEGNAKLQDVIFKWLLHANDCELSYSYGEEPELNDYHYIPQTQSLAENLKSCLQECDPLPRDFTQLFDPALFKFDTDLIPEAIKLYTELGVKHEALTLIPPQFETPMPGLQMATFPPCLREPPPPALDLYDLDEQFASERVKLAQLTNKCSDDDLEFYVQRAGEILNITPKLGSEKRGAKHILEHVFRQLANFKKLNQEHPAPSNGDVGCGGAQIATFG